MAINCLFYGFDNITINDIYNNNKCFIIYSENKLFRHFNFI